MYNHGIKELFLRSCNDEGKSKSTILKGEAAFELTEPYERDARCDLSAMNPETLTDFLVVRNILPQRCRFTMVSILRQYAAWCMRTEQPEASGGIFSVVYPEYEKIRNQYVFSDLDLDRRLGEVYGAEFDGTSKEIYRMYAWFAWSQMTDREAVGIKTVQLDLDTLSVRGEDREYNLSPFSRSTAEFLAASNSFRVENHNYEMIQRVRNEYLLRNNRGTPTASSLARLFATDFSDARKHGRTTSSLTYKTISASASFQIIYQNEMAGTDPDESVSRTESERGMSRENYELWKLAFETKA